MNTQKQHQFNEVRKSSMLFLQLGLVLALLIVYLALEFNSAKEINLYDNNFTYDETPFIVNDYPSVVLEQKEKPIDRISFDKKHVQLTDKIELTDDSSWKEEKILTPIEYNPTDVINKIVEVIEPEEEKPLPFILIEEAPIFPGCEGLDSLELKKCFTRKISRFVNRKFNTNLAEELNLKSNQKIFTQFTIDKNGTVSDILVKAPHKALEKEAIRVVQQLPLMTPGKQQNKPVSVKYTLPISFNIK